MKNLTPSEELTLMIQHAEEKKLRLELELESDAREFLESIKPGNLIKRGIGTFIQSDDLKGKAVKTGAGIAAAFLLKNLFFKNLKRGLITSLLGFAIKQGGTYLLEKNIIGKAGNLLHRQNGKKKEEELWDVQG